MGEAAELGGASCATLREDHFDVAHLDELIGPCVYIWTAAHGFDEYDTGHHRWPESLPPEDRDHGCRSRRALGEPADTPAIQDEHRALSSLGRRDGRGFA